MKRLFVLVAAVVVLAVVAVIALVVIEKLRSDDPKLLTSAPEIPTAGAGAGVSPTRPATTTAASTPSATTPTAAASTPSPASTLAPTTAPGTGALHFFIDASASSAKYVVSEKLARLPVESDAVGETKEIGGDIYLTPNGMATTNKSSFKVDLRNLKSDESLRDRFIRDNTLQASQFPFAEFAITAITGFPANYTEGTEVPVTIAGNMTIHGVTKPLSFTSKARRAGTALTGIADADFKMSDFGISPPTVPIAKAHDEIHVQVVIVAKQG